ncbi:MAG: hypothetical protein U0235_09465 [Polyangiaceae bacterium]
MTDTPRAMVEKHATADAAARARAIVRALQNGEPGSAEVFDAFYELDRLPAEVVSAELAAWAGPLPNLDALDDDMRRALRLPPRPLRLRVVSSAHDADVLDLGPVAEAQLRLAGRAWDGRDLPAEERLDGELEGSLAGTLRRLVLAEVDKSGPVLDVILFSPEPGSDVAAAFAAGTTDEVAFIAEGRVESRDVRLRAALPDVLFTERADEPSLFVAATERSPEPVFEEASPKTKPRERRAATSRVEKPAAKKVAAKAAPEKKGAKAPAAKKTAAPVKKVAAAKKKAAPAKPARKRT